MMMNEAKLQNPSQTTLQEIQTAPQKRVIIAPTPSLAPPHNSQATGYNLRSRPVVEIPPMRSLLQDTDHVIPSADHEVHVTELRRATFVPAASSSPTERRTCH
jgi:hypothetical protein